MSHRARMRARMRARLSPSLLGNEGRIEMGKIVVTEFVSLDGVMEDPGGDGNFKHKGWTFKLNRGGAGDKFKLDRTLRPEPLLLGRVAYERLAASPPPRDGDFAL